LGRASCWPPLVRRRGGGGGGGGGGAARELAKVACALRQPNPCSTVAVVAIDSPGFAGSVQPGNVEET